MSPSMNNRLQKLQSLVDVLFSGKARKVSEGELAALQDFAIWKQVCDEIVSRPFPPRDSGAESSAEENERQKEISLAKSSNWEIVCQEILDTEYSHVYYQRCYEELRRRGKSEQVILEMRRIAWYTAGWLNFPMTAWDWVSLDESDMLLAIQWLYDRKQISREERMEFVGFLNLHGRGWLQECKAVRRMINLYPCIVWPLVVLGAVVSYRIWKKRRAEKNAWLLPILFFVGLLMILGSVIWIRFGRFWADGLFAVYFGQ